MIYLDKAVNVYPNSLITEVSHSMFSATINVSDWDNNFLFTLLNAFANFSTNQYFPLYAFFLGFVVFKKNLFIYF